MQCLAVGGCACLLFIEMNSKIGVIVQARMGSRRLPGKVLRLLAGKPVLQYVLESLGQCETVERVVVATSRAERDDPIARFCERRGAACFRGALDDVAGRLLQAAGEAGFEALVRVSADSPLLDWRLVDRAVGLYAGGDYDLVTNVFPRSWPKGQSVEVLRAAVLRQGYSKTKGRSDREHVTRYFYDHPERFQIKNFASGQDWGSLNLCVDTEEDWQKIEKIIHRMDRPHWEYTAAKLVGMLAPQLAQV